MRKHLLGLAVTPLLAYPVLAGCLLLVDALAGERWLPHYLRYEQRRLWDQFWSDYAAATPSMYLVLGVVIVSFLFLRRRWGRVHPLYLVPGLALCGWLGAAYITGSWVGPSHLTMLAAGALVGVPAAVFAAGVVE